MNSNNKYDIIYDDQNKIITIISKIDINYKNIIIDIVCNNPDYNKEYTYRILTFNELIVFKDGIYSIIDVYSNKGPHIIPVTFQMEEYINESMIKLKLANIRRYNKKTQKDISEITGLSIASISNVESIDSTQSPTLRTINKYANAIGCELDIVPKF